MPCVLRTVTATRYVTPLREGGSLPAIVEADDDGLYVLKFRGAGQGPKALAAEIVAGELARGLGLPVPELVLIELDPALGNAEPDPEIQDLIAASAGINLGVDFLPGSLPYDPTRPPDPELAADVVWLDALITNVDRTPRNPNLLRWHSNLYLIDHGAALYAFHGADPLAARAAPFPPIRDHVLLPAAGLDRRGRRAAGGARRPGRGRALVPPEWADGDRVRRVPDAPARGAARLGRGGRACPRVAPAVPVRRAADRPARRARRGGQRRRRAVLPPAALPRRPHATSTRRCLPRSRPGCDPAGGAPRCWTTDRADRRAATRRRADRRGCRRPSASTGSSRRRARSSSPARSTPGSRATRRRELDRLFTRFWWNADATFRRRSKLLNGTMIDLAPPMTAEERLVARALTIGRRTALGILGIPRPPPTSPRTSPSSSLRRSRFLKDPRPAGRLAAPRRGPTPPCVSGERGHPAVAKLEDFA